MHLGQLEGALRCLTRTLSATALFGKNGEQRQIVMRHSGKSCNLLLSFQQERPER
jgi:hypothetical protein